MGEGGEWCGCVEKRGRRDDGRGLRCIILVATAGLTRFMHFD